jgi:hypothetical protein
MEVEWEEDADATSFLDGLDTSRSLEHLPLPAVGITAPPPLPEQPPPARPAGGKPARQSAKPAKPTKRARQNAEAQRNYRRREKEQKEQAVRAAQDLQQYMNGAEDQMNEVMKVIVADPVILERILSKLPKDSGEESEGEAEQQATGEDDSDAMNDESAGDDGAGSSSSSSSAELHELQTYGTEVLPFVSTTTRQMAEQNQRLLLNLPGDRYIEGEIAALAALHKEVTQAKAADERAGGSSAVRWTRLAQIPERYGKSMSDLLLSFVRWARQLEAVPPPQPGGSGGGLVAPPVDGALAEEPLFNVDRAFRKLGCYVEEIDKYAEAFGLTPQHRGYTETYTLSMGQFTSRRQAADGSTVVYMPVAMVMDTLQQPDTPRAMAAAVRAGA